ncbi:M28 family metallopeptidase [Clostridium sp.]|uniref:M28 family metallopeptidase n=1 Tax=Clostridium sp. TaxID=1506 RepID=UPI002FC6114D
MRKFVVSYFLSLCLIVTSLSFQKYCNIKTFDISNVKDNIEYLSSDTFKGRLTGTIENQMVAAYIKEEFVKNGLEPFEGTYYQSFKVKYPKKLTEEPMIAIMDTNNKIVKTFDYGVNYKEDLLNFRNTEIDFTKDNVVGSPNDNVLYVKTDKGSIIFYTTTENDLAFRSSFVENSKQDLYIIVTKETLREISEFLEKGYSIYTYIPFKVEETSVNNVMGVIKGKDSSKSPLVFSCHFDHLGVDLNNTIYRGALDNASGTSFLLELIKYIKSLGTPERDILFVAFNAEEFGLLGSNAFIEQYESKLKDSKVYNFDMIGSFDGVPLCIMGGNGDTNQTPFIAELTKTFESEKIYFNYLFEDASDHAGFRAKGIDAVTLCDNDMNRIHTPKDRVEYISADAIERCFGVINKELVKTVFNSDSNVIYLYHKESLVISLICSLLFIFIYKKVE